MVRSLVIGAVLLLGTSSFRAQGTGVQASVTTQTNRPVDANGNVTAFSTTVTITIQNLPTGVKWRDFHIPGVIGRSFPRLDLTPPPGSQTPTIPVTGGGSSQTWEVHRTRWGFHVNTGTGTSAPAGFGNGTYTFTLPWVVENNENARNIGMNWYLTKDGGMPFIKDNKIAGVGETPSPGGGPPSPAPWLPMFSVSANQGVDMKVKFGEGTTLPVDSGRFTSCVYEVYTSIQLNDEGTDPLGLGIESTTAPIPPSWGIQIQNAIGNVDSNGVVNPLPVIEVPAEPSLAGKSFYLVFAVKNPDGSIAVSSVPISVTIVQ